MTSNKKLTVQVLLFAVLAIASVVGLRADAASLTYTNSTNVYLSSPGITFTIQAGSVADNLIVGATNVTVSLSSSTGGTFTLISPEALSSSTMGSGGILMQTCSSGIETDTITQASSSETYVLTPTGSACSQPTSGGGGGGSVSSTASSDGGSSAYYIVVDGGATETNTTTVALSLYGTEAYTMELSNVPTFVGATWIPYETTMPWTLASDPGIETIYAQFRGVRGTLVGSAQASIDLTAALGVSTSTSSSQMSIEDRLAALQSDLAALLAESGQTTTSSMSGTSQFIFARNLTIGTTGNDVTELQLFLIRENAGPAAQKLAAHGTTKNFAMLTSMALIEFQKKAGIKPAIGYFGPITRAYVNNL